MSTLQHNIEEAKKRFIKDFVWNMTTDDHDVVAHYDEEDRDLEFWNAYKLEAFLEQELTSIYTLAQEEERREMVEKINKTELAPTDEDLKIIQECRDRFEACGYMQVAMLKKLLSTLSNNTLQ